MQDTRHLQKTYNCSSTNKSKAKTTLAKIKRPDHITTSGKQRDLASGPVLTNCITTNKSNRKMTPAKIMRTDLITMLATGKIPILTTTAAHRIIQRRRRLSLN